MATVPATPGIMTAFAVSIAGIVFTLLSKNVAAKRVVLPITLIVFSLMWLAIFRRATTPSPTVLGLVAAALVVNGVVVYRRIRYCPRCGRTVQDRDPATACQKCASAR
jgi:NADH pyrophosphatase NudC (nudix superfamily)